VVRAPVLVLVREDGVFLFFSPFGGGRYSFIDLKACWWVLRPFQSLEAPSKMEDGFRWVSVFVTDDQKSGGNLQRGLMLVILLVPGFFCKIPGMYCASFVIQSLFRKK
jgi:hypothetical protein